MKLKFQLHKILLMILSQTYSLTDVRDFVAICYDLALPMIRKKINNSKMNPLTVGMNASDLVYDCLGDLFNRDTSGNFKQLQRYFHNKFENLNIVTEEQIIIALRQLLFKKIEQNIIRIYSEIDPIYGKILRNVKLGIENSTSLKMVERFGENYITLKNVHLNENLQAINCEWLKQELARAVSIHDKIPTMLKKLYEIINSQIEYNKIVSLDNVVRLFKEIYHVGWKLERAEEEIYECTTDIDDIIKIAEDVCQKIKSELYSTYVESGKKCENVFNCYIYALRDVLIAEYGNGETIQGTYYDFLNSKLTEITKDSYISEHRTVFEYIAKLGKGKMLDELHKM
ncbi:MAG: hypothetical protein QME58_08705 [Bacteroidota bacterium]|nr:hypothetical protein [Bacteroidota bacterium]